MVECTDKNGIMDKERIDGFRSAFAPGETLFWQVPAAARERMAFYSENLPRLFLKKSRRYLRCPTTMRWNLCDFCRDRASAALKPCGTAPPCDAGIVLPVELVERESTRRLPCQTL
ncbi:MAG: hypothetical protein ACLTV1_06515 [Christensenellales bacterium]